MEPAKQIWFYEGSPVAKMVAMLRGRYNCHAIPRLRGKTLGKKKRTRNSESSQNLLANGISVVWLADIAHDGTNTPPALLASEQRVRWIGVAEKAPARRAAQGGNGAFPVYAWLPRHAPRPLVEQTIAAAFENIELAARERELREELQRSEWDLEELNRIGISLSAQQEISGLLSLILQKARDITGADAGSLYVIEESEEGVKKLRFKLTQNDSRQFPFSEFVLPVTETSMAGYVALHGKALNLADAYSIPEDRPYQFNDSYDRETGYRTRSLLTLPMKNARGEVLGIIQLINCKRDPTARLKTHTDVEREVRSFPERAERLGMSLASQAAIAYENKKLYDDIEKLFEGFVRASVTAIEQRDPTTSGHSFRVATLTTGLAEAVDRASAGPYARTHFSPQQMKQIRYAAVLHDFGKVGVREEVLVKAKKLYPLQLELVRERFEYIGKELEARTARQELHELLENPREEALERIRRSDQEQRNSSRDIDELLQFILQVNEPTVLEGGNFERLLDMTERKFPDAGGNLQPYLQPDEVRLLSIRKGSLDASERKEIESHVVHTFNFLMQIPWTKDLREIPDIARAHHEKLDGSGYPYKLRGDQIPFPAKMMTICDIYDALTAADRPYKKAVPLEQALAILKSGVEHDELDAELFRIFLEAKIFERTKKRSQGA
ncbi:MAG: HD domain-containing phosphohydrolase [Candidatus Acidiferrales bacterium]